MADACNLRLVVHNSFWAVESPEGVACRPTAGRSRSLSEGDLELTAGKTLVEQEDSCGELLSESTVDASDFLSNTSFEEGVDAEAMGEEEDEVVCLGDDDKVCEEEWARESDAARPPGVWDSDPCCVWRSDVHFVMVVPCQESAGPENAFARRRRGVRGGKRRLRNRGSLGSDDASADSVTRHCGGAGLTSASWADLSQEGDE